MRKTEKENGKRSRAKKKNLYMRVRELIADLL